MRRLIVIGAALGALGHAIGAAPPSPTMVQRQGSAAVWIRPGPGAGGRLTLRLSAEVTVKLAVEGPAALQVEPIRQLTDSPAWKMTKALPPASGPSGGHFSWEQTFQLVPLDKGDQPLLLTPLKYRAGNEEWRTVVWQPIPVTVTTVINRVDAGEASDITDIERLPVPRPWWEAWIWRPLSLLALIVVGTAWFIVRRGRRAAVLLSPDQAALRELDHVLALNLPRAGRTGRFSFLVSSILRRYLEKRYQLPARRQTTKEFLTALGQTPLFEPRQQEMVREFLERCDLANFAGVPPTPRECQDIAAAARQLVEQTAASSAI